ncbi:MAG: sensor histidine kinase, partial [Leptothrix sp. (in: b-proteobacteria)]
VDTDLGQAWPRGVLHLRQGILLGDAQVGELRYGLSSQLLRDAAQRLAQRNAALYASVLLLLAAVLGGLLTRLGRRLRALTDAGARLAGGSYGHAVPTEGRDELTLLGHELNAMADAVRGRIRDLEASQASVRRLNEELEARVERRTAELSDANRALEQSLGDLRRLQDGLVQAEKLASLGSLVAAVAHELNTPIGNALTVATAFADKAHQFGQQARTRLQRQALEQHLADSDEACALLQRNLLKASELITSFKHVAIDQTSSQRRPFDLAQTLGDVLATLSPGIRHRPLRVEADLAPGVRMLSYPGPLGQVLTNLYTNAVLHGYAPDQPGVLRLRSRLADAQTALIEFEDDGAGMDTATLRRIYDPFFTTRLGQGGSGLGMHIVHNLVLGLLHGRIDVASEPGRGTRVRLWLPLEAPAAVADAADSAGPSGDNAPAPADEHDGRDAGATPA